MKRSLLSKSPSLLFTLLLTTVCLLGWYCQTTLLFNSDVSWLMHAAERLLAGGTYANDFFEVNPPMILYLSLPPVLLAKFFGISHVFALRIYIFVLGLLSLLLCKMMLNALICDQHKHYRSVFILALAAIFFIMPICDFGQREHLLILLTMPYFLLTASRVDTYQPISRYLALIIGVLAGLGFAIKPYFYAPFILIEIYLSHYSLRRIPFIRTETVAVLAILALYILAIGIFHRDYLTDILPFITQYYYQSYSSPFTHILYNSHSFYVLLALLMTLICAKDSDQQNLLYVLCCVTIGLFIAYLMQRTHWYYHVYPVLAMSTLLIALSLAEISAREFHFETSCNLGLLSLVVMLYFIHDFSYVSQIAMHQTTAYFAIFIVIFSYLFYLAYQKKSSLELLGMLALLFYIGFIFYENVSDSIFSHWLFTFSTVMLFLLFTLFIPTKSTQIKLQYLFYSLVAALFLVYPFYQVSYIYQGNTSYRHLYQGLLNDLNKFPHQTLAFITDSSEFAFPAIDYTNDRFASRFGALGNLPVLHYNDSDKAYQIAYLRNKSKLDFIVNAFVRDIQRFQPDMVLVDRREADKTKKLGYYGNNQMNYIKLFSINSQFADLWNNYHYVTTIDGQPLYKFDIYMKG